MLAREYNWNVKNKLSRGYEETYFFVFREDGVYYNLMSALYLVNATLLALKQLVVFCMLPGKIFNLNTLYPLFFTVII
jgi:hypothetical protein